MDIRTLSQIQLIGSAFSLWAVWQNRMQWAVIAISIVLLLTGYHHLTEKRHK